MYVPGRPRTWLVSRPDNPPQDRVAGKILLNVSLNSSVESALGRVATGLPGSSPSHLLSSRHHLSTHKFTMLRRFSTFRKDRKKEPDPANSSAQVEPSGRSKGGASEDVDISVERDSVQSAFADFAQVLHAARRPLSEQTGDGSYLVKDESSGSLVDLKHMGFKNLKTLKDVVENRARGALVGDKTYLMERVVQVFHLIKHGHAESLACC